MAGGPLPRLLQAAGAAPYVWSSTHGIANLFVNHADDNRRLLLMAPQELLKAGLMIYLQSFGLLAADHT